jgi:hypothetical protein
MNDSSMLAWSDGWVPWVPVSQHARARAAVLHDLHDQ